MGDSDVLTKAQAVAERRSPPPWWVDTLKWILTGFVFPSAVCAFLLVYQWRIGQETLATLKEVGVTLHEFREFMDTHKSPRNP